MRAQLGVSASLLVATIVGTFAATLFCTIDGPVTGSKMVTISNGSFNVLRAS